MAIRGGVTLRRRLRQGREVTPPSGTIHTGVVANTVTATATVAGVLLLAASIVNTADASVSATPTLHVLHKGVVGATVDTTISAVPTKFGIQRGDVAATIETTASIVPTLWETHYGVVPATIDSTATPTPTVTYVGAVDATVDTTTALTGVCDRYGSLSVTVDSNTSIDATLSREGVVAATVDTTTTLSGNLEKHGTLSVASDATATASGSALLSGSLAVSVDTSVVADAYFAPIYEQSDFRIGHAVGPADSDQDWIAAVNTNISVSADRPIFRIRFAIKETANTNDPNPPVWKLYKRTNGGSWVEGLTLTQTGPMDTGRTRRQRITTGGTFEEGYAYTLKAIPTSYFPNPLSNATTELVFGTILDDGLSVSDYVEYAVFNNTTALDTYTNIPRVTLVSKVSEVIDQDSFRLRLDDGSETGASWVANANTNASLDIGKLYRLRFLLQQSSTTVTPAEHPYLYALQYKGVNAHKHYQHLDLRTDVGIGSGTGWAEVSIALSGDAQVMAVGSEVSAYGAGHEGRVYIYDWNGTTETWDYRNYIAAPNPHGTPPYNLQFGGAVALSNDGGMLVVGDPEYFDGSYNYVGEVYVYSWSGSSWSLDDTIANPAPSAIDDYFGWAVDIDDAESHIVLSWKDKGTWGTVEYYEPGGGSSWSHSQSITMPQLNTSSATPSAVKISGDGTVMWVRMSSGTTFGGYVYDRSGSTWTKRTGSHTFPHADLFDVNYAGDEIVECRPLLEMPAITRYEEVGTDVWKEKTQTVLDETAQTMSLMGADSDLSTIITHNYTTHDITTYTYEYRWYNVYTTPIGSNNLNNDQYVCSPIVCDESGYVEEQSTTTQQLGSGTFKAGVIATRETTQFTWSGDAVEETEIEFCIRLNHEYISPSDSIQLRVVKAESHKAIALDTYTNTPTITAVENPVVYTQYMRGRNDDNNEATATWIDAANTGWAQKEDTTFRVRFGLTNIASLAANTADSYKLEYNVNDERVGGYTALPDRNISKHSPVSPSGAFFEFASEVAISGDGKVMYVSDEDFYDISTSQSGMIWKYTYNEESGDWTYVWHYSWARGTNYKNGMGICTNDDGTVLAHGIPGYGSGSGRVIITEVSGTTFTARRSISSTREDFGTKVALSGDASKVAILSRNSTSQNPVIDTYSISVGLTSHTWLSSIYLSQDLISNNLEFSYDLAMSRDGLVLAVIDDGSSIKIYDWDGDTSWILRDTLDTGLSLPRDPNSLALNQDGSLMFVGVLGPEWQLFTTEYARTTTVGELFEYTTSWNSVGKVASRSILTRTYYGATMTADAERLYTTVIDDGVYGHQLRRVWSPVAAQATSTEAIRYANSTNITDPTATTQLITTGTFNAGQVVESGDADTTWTTTGEVTEVEFVLELDSGVAVYGDQYKLRVVTADNSALRGYGVLPVIDGEYVEHPIVEQGDYRGRNDDNYEATATWISNVNTAYDTSIGVPHRLRFTLLNTNQPFPSKDWPYKLQYNRNLSGTYNSGTGTNNSDDEFGRSVAISADKQVMAVGAPGYNLDTGRVTIYDWVAGAWSLRGTIQGTAYNQRFGSGVDLSSDGVKLVVGAEGTTVNGHSRGGEVYYYHWTGSAWSKWHTWNGDWFATNETQTSSYFGSDVAINAAGTQVVVGCKLYDYTGYTQGGKVYMLRNVAGTWYDDGTINLPVNSWQAGYSVTLNEAGTILGFGAPYYDSGKGLIYFADYSDATGWVLRTYGLAATSTEYMGRSIATTRNGLVTVVGTNNKYYWVVDWDGTDTPTGTTIRQAVSEPSYTSFSEGIDITPEGDIIVVGAPGSSDGNVYTGDITLDWTDMPPQADTESPIKFANSVWITDGEPTTQLLSSPDDFVAGDAAESTNAYVTWTADTTETSEVEYVVTTVEGKTVNGDLYHFRVLQNNGTETSEIPQTYTEIARMLTYQALLEGEVTATVDASVSITEIHEGQLSVTVDSTVIAEVQTTGNVDVLAESTVATHVTMDWAGKVYLTPDRIKVVAEGRTAIRDSLDVTFGVRCFATPSVDRNASIYLTSSSNIIPHATNLVNGDLQTNGNTYANIQGVQELGGKLSVESEVYTTAASSIYNEASIVARPTTSVIAKESLTRNAICGIIGYSITNLVAYNYKNASTSVTSIATTSIEPTLFKEAQIESSATTVVAASASRDINQTLTTTSRTSVVIDGTRLRSCRNASNIVYEQEITNVSEENNQTDIICGEII